MATSVSYTSLHMASRLPQVSCSYAVVCMCALIHERVCICVRINFQIVVCVCVCVRVLCVLMAMVRRQVVDVALPSPQSASEYTYRLLGLALA